MFISFTIIFCDTTNFYIAFEEIFVLIIKCNYLHFATSTQSQKKWAPYYQKTGKPKSLLRGHNDGRGPEKWSMTLWKEQNLFSIKEKIYRYNIYLYQF